MSVRFKVFESAKKSWQVLFEEAAAFASEITPERLAGISHCQSQTEVAGPATFPHHGIVTVWYLDGD